jgi:hypothetical protein
LGNLHEIPAEINNAGLHFRITLKAISEKKIIFLVGI